ncbi:MAG: sugar phosphate isomerase/epimerase [Clostridia bacterium]|nr:sugar phosphate isomerase/epimerase [Clostridia bacterium]
MKLGIQLYTLRNDASKDLEGTLKAIKEAGYDGVELAGFYGHAPEEMKSLLDKYGLVPMSAHIGLDSAEKEGVLEEYEKVGIKYAVIPMTSKPTEETKDALLTRIVSVVNKFKAHGFVPGYHNHNYEFDISFGGVQWHDTVMAAIPDAMAELDLCWLEVGGGDSVEYINRYKGRAEILHLKDYVGRVRYERRDGTPPAEPLAEGLDFDQRAVGDGVLDVCNIIKAAEKCGTKWLIVELDEPQKGKTALECAVKSAANLKKLL